MSYENPQNDVLALKGHEMEKFDPERATKEKKFTTTAFGIGVIVEVRGREVVVCVGVIELVVILEVVDVVIGEEVITVVPEIVV